jgi:uroporphyrinogen decarboxylase
MFPANWESEKKRLLELGVQPPWLHSIRGPVTFATAVYGVENLIYLILDNPALAERFRNAIRDTVLNMADIMDREAPGRTGVNWFCFFDDDCALLNADMYEGFGYPIIKDIFDRYCPGEKDYRYQHSDSDMMHLLPILGRLNFSKVNFGPKCTVTQIREHCPNTIIQGQLAPFTFSRNEEENMILETLRDFELSGGGLGMAFNTSGQTNNGSLLTGMRLIMATIQTYCRRAP